MWKISGNKNWKNEKERWRSWEGNEGTGGTFLFFSSLGIDLKIQENIPKSLDICSLGEESFGILQKEMEEKRTESKSEESFSHRNRNNKTTPEKETDPVFGRNVPFFPWFLPQFSGLFHPRGHSSPEKNNIFIFRLFFCLLLGICVFSSDVLKIHFRFFLVFVKFFSFFVIFGDVFVFPSFMKTLTYCWMISKRDLISKAIRQSPLFWVKKSRKKEKINLIQFNWLKSFD